MHLPMTLSGNIGSRLWPFSCEAHPKPFSKLGDWQNLLQKNYIRARNILNSDQVVIGIKPSTPKAGCGRTIGLWNKHGALHPANDSVYKDTPTMHRPWGTCTVLHEGLGFKPKRIEVKPSARLSLQPDKYKSAHWVMVSGKALVTNGEEQIELESNQSTYIPLGNKHRLENLGTEQLILIEVQCGAYLGEDDIVRYEDIYERTE